MANTVATTHFHNTTNQNKLNFVQVYKFNSSEMKIMNDQINHRLWCSNPCLGTRHKLPLTQYLFCLLKVGLFVMWLRLFLCNVKTFKLLQNQQDMYTSLWMGILRSNKTLRSDSVCRAGRSVFDLRSRQT